MSSSWWTLICSRLPDPVGGFIFIPVRKVHQKISLAAVMQRKTTRFRVCTNDQKRFIIKEKRLWNSSTPHAQTRSVITVTQCWDVYTGPKDQLEYSH